MAALAALVLVILLLQLREPAVLRYRVDLEAPGTELRTVTVYYLDADSLSLAPVKREVLGGTSRRVLAQDLVTYLGEAPDRYRAPLPGGTRLLHFFEDGEGEVILDFNAPITTIQGRGIAEERLRLSALVHTLAENVSGVDQIRLLVLGRPLEYWGEHLAIETLEVSRW
jgi:spore germination protein GerM